jgi:hypothetical protein
LTPVVLDVWVRTWSKKTKRAARSILVDLVIIAPGALFLTGTFQAVAIGALVATCAADISRWWLARKHLRTLREYRDFVSLDEKLMHQTWLSVTGHNREHARKLLLERKRLRADFKQKNPELTKGWTP